MATISNVNGQLELTIANKIEYYQFPKLSNLTWVFNNDGNYYIHMIYEDDYFVKIRLIDITNQPGWTNDQPGATQAVKDISTWIGLVTLPLSGLATEATLLNVLTAVDNMRDYEVRLVVDSTPVTPVTWLEVRYWDAQSGSLGTPVYYLAGSTTPGSPVLPISYINNQTLLSQILAELQGTLDVNITNAAVTVNGTVAVTQSTSPWVVSGSVNIGTMPEVEIKNDSGNPIPISDAGGSITVDGSVTVSATDLDIRNLVFATDKVDMSGSSNIAVTDGGGSLTVDANNLDIRDLTFASDKVDASGSSVKIQDGAGNALTSTVVGADTALDVNIVGGVTLEVNLDQNNDQVQVYGSDLTAPIATDASGHLQVDILTIPEVEIKNDSGNPLPVSGTVAVTQSTSPWVVGDGGGSITVDGTIAATQSGTWNITAVTGPVALPTGAATESTLSTLNSQFTAVTRTPALIRTSASGTISAGARSISVFNAGAAAGSILGIVGNILPGEVFEFSAGGENDTLAAFAYNGTGTTLVITSIV